MKELILIKLGGSVITNKKKEYTVRENVISRLAVETREALKTYKGRIIVGHGAGSFAHVPAAKYRTKEGLIGKESLYGMAVTEDAARKLNAIVIKNFLDKKLPVFSFSPASFLISDREVLLKSYIDPIDKALEIGSIPVVYGDVILDKEQGCTIFSTEKVFAVLAKELRKDYQIRIIYVTDVDGVYDNNGKTIPVISGRNFKHLKSGIAGVKGIDVTGGMLHKVEEGLALAGRTGIKTLIVNGTKKGSLEKAILYGKVGGTLIV